ncbi:MAG: HAD-IA family hydrolase [Rhodocyclaceae bacterium]|nr:HAD-IA family hydrolase [Rhodocyclaceae bacterium]
MQAEIQAIIFDCDGTLVDSEEPGLDVFRQFLLARGYVYSREEIHRQCRGAPMSDSIAWLAGLLGGRGPAFEADLEAQIRALMSARFRAGLREIPGALQLLGRLKIPFCVATNGPREKVELTLGLAGLRGFFGDRILSAFEVGSFKPEPGLFLRAAEVLGVLPARCAVVEDSLTGIRAGLGAGMQVFSLHPRDATPGELAARVRFIASLSELDEVLHGPPGQ